MSNIVFLPALLLAFFQLIICMSISSHLKCNCHIFSNISQFWSMKYCFLKLQKFLQTLLFPDNCHLFTKWFNYLEKKHGKWNKNQVMSNKAQVSSKLSYSSMFQINLACKHLLHSSSLRNNKASNVFRKKKQAICRVCIK